MEERRSPRELAPAESPVSRFLIVPGYHGSGDAHWQTWLQREEPAAIRVQGIDWESPVLASWVRAVEYELYRNAQPLWLVAHSFGCLVSAHVAARLPHRVAGLLLVAPADPARFTTLGAQAQPGPGGTSLEDVVPRVRLGPRSVLVASRNDPWLSMSAAARWAKTWGSSLVDIGEAGHVNSESGHGPWPFVRSLLHVLAPPDANAVTRVECPPAPQPALDVPFAAQLR